MVARPGDTPEFVTRAEASALFDRLWSKTARRAAELSAGRGSQVTSEDLNWALRARHWVAVGALAARDVPMFSRLYRAVQQLPKKWDNALPARQWLDFHGATELSI